MYVAEYYDSEGQGVSFGTPRPLCENRAVATVMARQLIEGRILIVSRHWILVGSDRKRIMVVKV
ncbi:hypothetical protein VPH159E362A_0025 [Vibrio phage 159E36-2a]